MLWLRLTALIAQRPRHVPEQLPAVKVFRLIAQWRLPQRCSARVALHSSQLRAASTKSLCRYHLSAMPVSGSQRLPASCNEPRHHRGTRVTKDRVSCCKAGSFEASGDRQVYFRRLSPRRPMAAVIAPADRADLARKPIAGLVSIMSARSGSACVDISITGTGAPSSLS